MDELPDWPPGTVAILSTAGDGPHAIPISTAVKAGPRHVLLALATSRESLARLTGDERCALTILARDDVAITAHCKGRVVGDVNERVVAVELGVDAIQDHGQPTFRIEAGVRWDWTDEDAAARDRDVRAALLKLAARRSP